jgi:phosphopantothenoylcysteine decarboxylase / phosphopantothenate---cysteine ligase
MRGKRAATAPVALWQATAPFGRVGTGSARRAPGLGHNPPRTACRLIHRRRFHALLALILPAFMTAATDAPFPVVPTVAGERPGDLAGRHLVLGLSGGIACYKSAELLRALVKAGATVQVVMTAAAEQFITPVTMQALSNRSVYTSQWDVREPNAMAHINLSREADALLVAPASADFIARLAQGRADELLSLLCLARPAERCHLLLAPAMNREMWAHPATRRNVQQVIDDGARVFGPAAGDQACGEVGDGRMLEADALLQDVIAFFQPKPLAGRRVLITAGPTFEPIDPVRGITNLSSGKMGFAIARAASEAGAEVLLVAGPVHLPTPRGVQRVDVQTARQMHEVVLAAAPAHDVFVATAAVADWRPAELSEHKIKKNGSKVAPSFELVENPDILAAVAALPEPQRPYCVGFAAESHDLLHHAREKLVRKHLPLIVGNLGPATFGRDDNALLLVDAEGHRALPQADKLTLARQLVTEIAARLADSRLRAGA